MAKKRTLVVFLACLMVLTLATQSAMACTIYGVGKNATTDGSTIVTHNDDSSSADFRLWIIPAMEGGPDAKRDIVIDSHNYGDFGQYPAVKDYGKGTLIAEMDQPEDSIPYFHSRYSFLNAKGVATSESTFNINKKTEYGAKVFDLIYGKNDGLIDCWNAQDIGLERASTAREFVEIVGDVIETYLWRDPGETLLISDGNELWIMEAYGLDLWCAIKVPDDALIVAANRARIQEFNFEDTENYLCSANFKSFAVDNGLWSEDSGEPFSPADLYAPSDDYLYASRRVWRSFDLVAPGQNFDSTADRFPLWVTPEEKLSVQDVFELTGDYYEGTEYDVSRTAMAGDYGNPLNVNNKERTINLFRTCYVMIAHTKNWLPDEAKSLVWYGYGAPDSTFLTPLWASMTRLPEIYQRGNRYEDFTRDSGWWINSYVQQIATINYDYAIELIHERRGQRMDEQYEFVAQLQETAAQLIRDGKKDMAVKLLTDYACNNAEEWFDIWLKLGDELLGDLMWGTIAMRNPGYSDWYKDIVNNAEMKPIVEPTEAPKN